MGNLEVQRGANADVFPYQQYITVAKNAPIRVGVSYQSVKDACDFAATVATASNRYFIDVKPGEYTESPFTVPGSTFLNGPDDWGACHLITNNNAADFITLAALSGISQFSITGPTGVGFAAILQNNTGTSKASWCNIRTGYYGVHATQGRTMCIGMVSDVPGTPPTQLFRASGTGTLALLASHAMVGNFQDKFAFFATGSGQLLMDLTVARVGGGTGGTGIYAEGNAVVRVIGGTLALGATAIHHEGSAVIDVIATQIKSNFTTDIRINGTGGRVSFTGSLDKAKIVKGPGAIEPFINVTSVTGSPTDGLYIFGDLYIGSTGNVIPLTALIRATRDTGIVDGGDVTISVGLDVNVSLGEGFVFETGIIKRVTWNNQTLTLPANQDKIFVYMQSNGTATSSTTFPDSSQFILLSIVATDATNIRYIARDYVELPRAREDSVLWMRDVVGPLNKSGGIVTENVTTARNLDVTASDYWYNNIFVTAAGGTPVTFTYWYRDGLGGWIQVPGQTAIDNTQFDNGSGTLATMTNNRHKGDLLFVSVNLSVTTYHVVYAQSEHQQAAQVISNPTAPDILRETACRLARLVVLKSATNLARIDDERPRLGQLASALTPAVDHGSLSGLADDDHPQYQLTSAGVINTISAGTQSVTTGQVSFADSHGISFGLNAGTLTASVAAGGAPGSISAGTTSVALGQVVFSNSNNVSFGLNGSTVTATATFAGGGGGVALSAGTQSVSTGTVNFANSNGLTFGMSGSSQITGSYTVPTVTNSSWTVSDAGTSGTVGRLAFTNLNGVTLSLSSGAGGSHTIVGSHNALTSQSNQNVTAANGGFAFQTLSFSNLNGISFGTSAGSAITASHNALTSQSNQAASASNGSFAFQTLNFSNANNVTFGTSAGGIITASVAPGGGGGIGGIAVNASTTYTSGTVVFSAGPNITLNTNGQTISISAPNPGGAPANPQRFLQIDIPRLTLSNITHLSNLTAVPFFMPFRVVGTLTISRLNYEMSRSTSGSNQFTVTAGIYSYVNDTQITLVGSASASYSNTATASISGIRRFNVDGFNVSTYAPGGYVVGLMFSAGNTLSANYFIRGGNTNAPQIGAVLPGADQYNTATSYNIFPFYGRFSNTTAAFPGSVGDSQVRGQFSGASHPIPAWIGLNND